MLRRAVTTVTRSCGGVSSPSSRPSLALDRQNAMNRVQIAALGAVPNCVQQRVIALRRLVLHLFHGFDTKLAPFLRE